MSPRKALVCALGALALLVQQGCSGGKTPSAKPQESATASPAPVVDTSNDTKIRTLLEEKFKTEAALSGAKIAVTVSGGQATLTGEVKTPAQKDKAEDIVLDAIKPFPGAGLNNELLIAE